MTTSSRIWKDVIGTLKSTGLILLGIVVLAFCLIGFDELDTGGHIVHHKMVDLYMSNDWLVGENRSCFATIDPSSDGRQITLSAVTCSADTSRATPHNISVAFWGRIKSPDLEGSKVPIQIDWTCRRESDDFVCRIPKL